MSDPTLPQDSVDPIEQSVLQYRQDPTPDNLRMAVDQLEPTIRYSLINLNAQNDPVLENQAKIYAAEAVRNYDPERGAGIKTFVSSQLKQMHRFARQAREPLHLPERAVWERNALYRGEQEFIEKKGREPSLAELSDWTAIPRDRISKIRNMPHSVSESQISGSLNNPVDLGEDTPEYHNEAMEYVYQSLTPTDQKIFEYMTGYDGAEQLPPAEIEKRMNLSQSQISRRFAGMMLELKDIEDDLVKLNLEGGVGERGV
jgi:DNA-directed RNA polymerase specialized sigma subunit